MLSIDLVNLNKGHGHWKRFKLTRLIVPKIKIMQRQTRRANAQSISAIKDFLVIAIKDVFTVISLT